MLLDEPLDIGCFSDEATESLRMNSTHLFMPGESPNACFVLRTAHEEVHTFAGLTPVGLTRWTGAPRFLRIPLYASPDAFSVAEGGWEGSLLDADLIDSGVIGEPFQGISGKLLGVRLGSPDISLCENAAHENWIDWIRRRRILHEELYGRD